MATDAALLKRQFKSGTILTFIVPAPNGCNLDCPFCFIRQRKEHTTEPSLTPMDYAAFIRQIAARESIAAICVQGYEPLLPEARVYTRSILWTARSLHIPTGMVTNGVGLEPCSHQLATFGIGKIAVSLDAADAATHDRQRGKQGAWEAAVKGLRCLLSVLPTTTELTVTSVLVPKRRAQLDGMPALLKDIGVKCWTINAMRKIEPGKAGRPWGDRHKILEDMITLQRAAKDYDIDFNIDDEFGTLSESDVGRDVADINALSIRRLERPSGVFRLLPNGQCSTGRQILEELTPDTPRWVPGEMNAGDFIEQLRGSHSHS